MQPLNTLAPGRYLVAGGAGFIGSHLCEALRERGAEVLCVDNFVTGARGNIRALLGSSRFELVEHDLSQPLSVTGALAGIFHFASPASPVDYAMLPIETLHVNSFGTDHLLKLAREKACPILVASTSEVYGDPLEHPQRESYWGNVNPIGVRGCYDEAKRYLEALTMAYLRVHKVRTRIVRIFNTYGPRMRAEDGRVVPNFCMQALSGQDLTIYGDGSQTRSFCYVDDLVEGILRLFGSDHNEPVNIGNPTEFTILQFAKEIIRHAGTQSRLVYRPLPQDDPRTRQPDITKARTLLGWEPRVDLESGLKRTLQYFRGQQRTE